MGQKKRVSVSIDGWTYERLAHQVERHRFSSVRELLSSLLNVVLDRLEGGKAFDLPDEEGSYIDSMFAELTQVDGQPEETIICSYTHKKIRDNVKRR
jgi:hypothetical protein